MRSSARSSGAGSSDRSRTSSRASLPSSSGASSWSASGSSSSRRCRPSGTEDRRRAGAPAVGCVGLPGEQPGLLVVGHDVAARAGRRRTRRARLPRPRSTTPVTVHRPSSRRQASQSTSSARTPMVDRWVRDGLVEGARGGRGLGRPAADGGLLGALGDVGALGEHRGGEAHDRVHGRLGSGGDLLRRSRRHGSGPGCRAGGVRFPSSSPTGRVGRGRPGGLRAAGGRPVRRTPRRRC